MLVRLLAPFFRIPYVRGKSRAEDALRRWIWEPEAVKVRGGLRMALDPAEWSQLQLLKRNWMEPLTINLYEKLLRPGDTFADIGAHVGFHAVVAAAAVGSTGAVIAVEPQPENAARLLVNARLNGFTWIKLFAAAAGDVQGHVWLRDQVPTDRSVLSLDPAAGKNLDQSYRVPILRMEDVLAECDQSAARVVKIDVEGFELEVLKGFGATLAGAEHIIFEYLDPAEKRERSAALIEFLLTNGFRLSTVDGKAWQLGDPVAENNLWAAR